MSRFDLFFVLVDECNEVTDYAIARRIIDLHTRQEESVEREYSLVGGGWSQLCCSHVTLPNLITQETDLAPLPRTR